MRMYQAVSTATIPVHVAYTCAFCGKVIEDRTQKVVVRGESGGGFTVSDGMRASANSKAQSKASKVLSEIANGDLRHAYLTCACPNCQKRQPWARFIEKKDWVKVLFFLGAFIVIGFLYFLITQPDKLSMPPAVAALFGALMLPYLLITLKNAVVAGRVRNLDPKYLPKITPKT